VLVRDAKSGDLDKLRVNNRLRGIIRGALGTLTLQNVTIETATGVPLKFQTGSLLNGPGTLIVK